MPITPEQAVAQGILFAGNPDTVYRQIIDFQRKAGPFSNLNIIGRSLDWVRPRTLSSLSGSKGCTNMPNFAAPQKRLSGDRQVGRG